MMKSLALRRSRLFLGRDSFPKPAFHRMTTFYLLLFIFTMAADTGNASPNLLKFVL